MVRIESEVSGSTGDDEKLPKLPKSISTYIRRLKAEGKWVEAMSVAQQEREKKGRIKRRTRQEKAREELNKTVRELLETNDPEIEAVMEIRGIWLLEAAELINPEERLMELLESIDTKAPQLKTFIEGRLVRIREEVKPLMPAPQPLVKRR